MKRRALARARPRARCGAVFVAAGLLCSATPKAAERLPVGPPVEVVLPDYRAELLAFDASPPDWNETLVNAGMGSGRGAPARRAGWIRDHWIWLDYVDRSGDSGTHDYLEHRGIFHEVYGYNEYQETIHFHETGALALFGENGIARDLEGKRVLSPQFNLSVQKWARQRDDNAYIADNNAPRWSAVMNYDWLTSPLFGDAISQDNIGGPTERIGAGQRGRYDDYSNRKFFHYLETTNRLAAFRGRYKHVRHYVREKLMDAFRQLPPYAPRGRGGAAARKIARDPVMAEYQLFQHMAHLHAFSRYARENRLIARRAGRSYDVHGNQGGFAVGQVAYQVVLGDLVDTIWFESAGMSQYDLFEKGWSNAWGPFRFELGEAMARGRKPLMMMSKPRKKTRDLIAHEWAEASAGGGVLLVDPDRLAEDAVSRALLEDYLRFREEHRALFERRGRRRLSQVALLYSVPTLLYDQFVSRFSTPPVNDLAGAARSLEEGHIPFDVVLLDHPDLRPDRLTLEDLQRYRVLVAPSLECLSERHAALLRDYLAAGGTLAVLGGLGQRDEHNHARAGSLIDGLVESGRVVTLLDGRSFPSSRSPDDARARERSRRVFEAVRGALEAPLLEATLPRMLWVKTWSHSDGFVSAHFVNYQIDFASGKARTTEPVALRLRLPPDVQAEEARWLVPGQPPKSLPVQLQPGSVSVTLPPIRVYGVLVVGRKGVDETPSLLRRGDRYLLRARHAGAPLDDIDARIDAVRGHRSEPGPYMEKARQLLERVAEEREQAYLAELERMANPGRALLALDFGGSSRSGTWRGVGPATAYEPGRGYGWLPSEDPSTATPEERDYVLARRQGIQVDAVTQGKMVAWPHPKPPPEPLRTNLMSGRAQRFRIDLPPGRYRVDVVHANFSWTHRNLLVSGLTRAEGRHVLLDTPLDKGALRRRSFVVDVEDGALDLVLGGPTGFGIAALSVAAATSEDAADPLATDGLRSWKLSPRHPNPDWYPIGEVRGPPETDGDSTGWTVQDTAAQGLPVVDLGPPQAADIGDVVYARAFVKRETAVTARLSLGASSAAIAWVNGERVAFLPNLKGLMRDEAVAQVRLRAGENEVLLKLQRFWERRWLFYASLSDE